MTELTNYLTTVLAIGTLLSQVFLVVVLILLIARKSKLTNIVFSVIKENALLLVFLISLSGMGMSLYFSEIARLVPCSLCWLQRIFLYPQVFLYLLAFKKRDKGIGDYGLLLSIIGFIIAAYQYSLQVIQIWFTSADTIVPCILSGSGPSCSSYYFLKFGYMTFPLMSLTAFALIIVIWLVHKYWRR